ncbi:MAG: ankyrin repeat domain-containing protein [Flavobacterium sp. JAD_PAG50586_2]|nr:MAG: ankyrin repeat domain-containing protein [Flavobacterium sp. JAD_PAG50586_2]
MKSGANPNVLLGESKDSTPFMNAIQYQENCDLFYIQTLVKFKADINKKIVSENRNILSDLYSIPLLAAISKFSHKRHECLETVKFLVDSGADINACIEDSASGVCEGVISRCLHGNSLKALKYFVIEKKISIPEKVYVVGQINPKTMKIYGLSEALNSKKFQYEDFTDKYTGFVDRSDLRNSKEEILNYLKAMEKK